MRKRNKTTKPIVWILVGIGIAILISGGFTSIENLGKSKQQVFLENQNYVVNDIFCNSLDNWGYVNMETYGDREEQVKDGQIALLGLCPNAQGYSVRIIEPTKECGYLFDGELIRGYFNEPYDDEKLKLSDDFLLWKVFLEKQIQDETIDINGYLYYQEYLEEGLTGGVLYSIDKHTFEDWNGICKEK